METPPPPATSLMQHLAHRFLLLATLTLAMVALAPAAAPRAQTAPFQTQTFRYDPPARTPKGERKRYVAEPADAVFADLWAHMEAQGFTLQSVDPEARIIVAQFGGDPQPYIDCGRVTQLVDGKPADPPKTYGAARAQIRTAKTVNKRRYGLLRQMRLDVRLTARVEEVGKGARVYANAIYVATKTTYRLRKGGVPEALLSQEVISFTSDEVGRFKTGTVCVANGKAEAIPLEPFKSQS